MIASGVIPYEELSIIKRQDPGLIITNCHHIKNGESITIDNSNGTDFIFLKQNDPENIQKVIVKTIKETIPSKYKNIDLLRDIQVISPMREKTALSCLPLNKLLQAELNSNRKHKKTEFQVGDKVINVKNNYSKNITNGYIGYVDDIDIEGLKIVVEFENPDREVTMHLWENDIQLAYAITCHKFQGSEAPIIIVPIHSTFAPIIMQRNWLYTAVSRAKDLCILIGQEEEVNNMINRNRNLQRYTSLTEFLQGG